MQRLRICFHGVSLLLLIASWQAPLMGQSTFDFGIGGLTIPEGDGIRAVIYSRSDTTSDTLVVLSGSTYTIYPERKTTRALLGMFEEDSPMGLPLLSVTDDSSWAQVSIEPVDLSIKLTGWIKLTHPRTQVRLWGEYLMTQSMVLRTDRPIRFYSKPDKRARWKIRLFRYPHHDEYSYILHPIRRQGRWLLVELQTPFDPCGNSFDAIEQEYGVRPRILRVWIEFLDERFRPLVQAPMRC